jgi:hypothetical protein
MNNGPLQGHLGRGYATDGGITSRSNGSGCTSGRQERAGGRSQSQPLRVLSTIMRGRFSANGSGSNSSSSSSSGSNAKNNKQEAYGCMAGGGGSSPNGYPGGDKRSNRAKQERPHGSGNATASVKRCISTPTAAWEVDDMGHSLSSSQQRSSSSTHTEAEPKSIPTVPGSRAAAAPAYVPAGRKGGAPRWADLVNSLPMALSPTAKRTIRRWRGAGAGAENQLQPPQRQVRQKQMSSVEINAVDDCLWAPTDVTNLTYATRPVSISAKEVGILMRS